MRITDGSICAGCYNFDHTCFNEGCMENCNCEDKEVTIFFMG